MASTVRLLGSEANLASATNMGFAKLVRVLNNKTSVQVITQKNAGGTTLATVTLAAGSSNLFFGSIPSVVLASGDTIEAQFLASAGSEVKFHRTAARSDYGTDGHCKPISTVACLLSEFA